MKKLSEFELRLSVAYHEVIRKCAAADCRYCAAARAKLAALGPEAEAVGEVLPEHQALRSGALK